MDNERLERMRQLLKPISHERAQAIMDERIRPEVQQLEEDICEKEVRVQPPASYPQAY